MDLEPSNTATELARVGIAWLNSLSEFGVAERSRLRTGHTDDYVGEDRRKLIGMPAAGRDELVEQIASYWNLGAGAPEFSMDEVLAVRGDRLVLFRFRICYGPAYETSTLLLAGYTTDGRRCRAIQFDVEDLEVAVAELDRLHWESR